MKKLLLGILACLTLGGCQQTCTRQTGGTTTINLPKGQKLIEATWKEDNIWYLMEPMDSDYIPKTKTLKESSALGIAEGTVIFIEEK